MRALVICGILGLWGLTSGCATVLTPPDLGGLYNRSAQFHGPGRNPIILIPGILGSRLLDEASGRLIWGAFEGSYAHPGDPEGARLIGVPMREGVPLNELRDDVVSDGALDRLKVRLLGLPFEQRAYLNILGSLGVGGYRDEELGMAGAIDYGDEHFTCFQFDYDWRRDNVENAKLLHEFIKEKREYVATELKARFGVEKPEVKFDIVAHSMGGLVTRYFLRYGSQDLPADGSVPEEVPWTGSDLVERVVLVGTPNSGSVEAVVQLVEGLYFAAILPTYRAALLGTMPSIYQLFPRPRHGAVVDREDSSQRLDIFDPQVWIDRGLGLASPDADRELKVLLPDVETPEERRRIGLDHLRKCLLRARQFAGALDRPASHPPGLEYFLFAGDAVPTRAVVAVDAKSGELETLSRAPGDGTVLRTSTLADERVGAEWGPELVSPITWRNVSFLFSDHIGMTKDPAFTDNVLYVLLEAPR